jgi:hypothetical protein
MKLRFRWNSSKRKVARPAYPIRPRSFVASLGIHGALVTLAAFAPSYRDPAPRPIYTELIRPLEDKIVWRDFREKLPDVAAAKKTPTAQAERISRRTLVADSPKAKSATQFIWQPAPKIEIKQDLPLPNLVSRMDLPAPPPPAPVEEAKPRPTKPFVPPTRASTPAPSPAPVPILDPQAPLIPIAPSAPSVLSASKALPLPPRPTRAFIPPSRTTDSSPAQVPILDPQAPSINTSAPSGPAVLNASKGLPLPALPGAPAPSPGNGTADIAIASLHPADRATLPPGGARAGQFSEAPTLGPAAAGNGDGVSVPNLTVRDPSPAGADVNRRDIPPSVKEAPKKAVDLPLPAIAPRTILYAERIRNIPMSTLSAPLRPASRTIPRDIDARFQGRYVYAMVMPIENLPMYGGDWIMWFAERNQKPGDAPFMHAPILFRKFESTEKVELPAQTLARFQLAGTITKEGRIEGISLITKTGAVIEQALMRDLASWEFRPATRDGAPVDVEVVIEIPFNLKQIAEGGKP